MTSIRSTFTRENALSGGIPFAAAQRDIATRNKAHGRTMYDASLLTHMAHSQGLIGTGKGKVSQGAYVKSLGFNSPSYGSLLVTLGRAAVVHMVEPGTPAWTFLSSNKGKAAPVTALIRGEYTPESAETLAAWVAGTAEVPAGEKKARAAASEKDGDKSESESPAEVRVPVSAPALLDALAVMVRDMDRGDWSKVEDRINALVTKENTIRAAAAKRTPAKRTARKAA